MSQVLIQQYLNELKDLRKVSGTNRESVVREAFKDLLKGWARSHDLIFVPEYEVLTAEKDRRYIDGALLHTIRLPFGYWEAKDEKDNLDAEIEYKLRRGYPQDNIIFEDSTEAVLIQDKQEIKRCAVDDVEQLEKLLTLFFSYERTEIAEFRHAVEQFKIDLPDVLGALREMIDKEFKKNDKFRDASKNFLKHAKEAINTSLTEADVREMLIQHVLTEEIFSKVFGEDDFHRHNNVAKELYALEETFFTGDLKKSTLRGLAPYYSAIRIAAAQITSHHEKQTFLKVIYENFYKVYNVKAADRLGVVYTPNEIVRFIVESADFLCEKSFNKNLIDKNVEILDPATGTGTFICEIMEHFRGQEDKLRYKYQEELHANEVAILPYYVANLNIEATYAAITGRYVEFRNLCFVDTLDNVGLHTAQRHSTGDLFGSVSEENVARIKRQNSRKISVIIGNPPYNANQLNENDNNKNREYPEIDGRIKNTYIDASNAQKTKLYDMYARFFRWASDRLDQDGVIAFITNRSFIDSKTFDGFREVVAKEFNEIYLIDLGGDIWGGAPETRKNVFGIRVGVAISFFVKKKGRTDCRIYYSNKLMTGTAEDKLLGLQKLKLNDESFRTIKPNEKNDWLIEGDSEFSELLPLCTKQTKSAKRKNHERAIFKFFSLGVVTARDEWVYDFSQENLISKVEHLISIYNKDMKKLGGKKLTTGAVDQLDYSIKWTRAVKADLARGTVYKFKQEKIMKALYRPYTSQWLYYDSHLNEMRYQLPAILGDGAERTVPMIIFTDAGSQKPFMALATDSLFDYHLVGAAAAAVAVPIKRFSDSGESIENITDWAYEKFQDQFKQEQQVTKRKITKDSIFYYVYGVLHDPVYLKRYALNLKRELPRIPFYNKFWEWADWGKELMDLHLNYHEATPARLERIDVSDGKAYAAELSPKVILKADQENGRILIDSETSLQNIPDQAWQYKLGNRSAIEWVLDQYKESRPKDKTVREKFNTYNFLDHKEDVIDLLMRVTTISVRTRKIIKEMEKAHR